MEAVCHIRWQTRERERLVFCLGSQALKDRLHNTTSATQLSFSIAEGIGLGFISYILIKIVSGRARECSVATYVIAVIFGLKYLFL